MWRKFITCLALLPGTLVAETLMAEDSSSFVAGSAETSPSLEAATSSAGTQLLNVAGMLAVVVILIVTMAWVARRLMGGNFKVGRHIQILEVFPLGRNEKLCLARVGERTLLLGITPQGINPIESWDNWPDTGEDPVPGQSGGEFQKTLSRLVKSS